MRLHKISFAMIMMWVLISFCPLLQAQTVTGEYLTTDDGANLFVKKSGQGALCIFIHGGPGAWSKSFEDLKGSNLEQHLTMVYYDQRGCGRSDKSPQGNYSLDRMIADIDLVRRHFNVDKVYLMSHSFGGILAVNYALKFPDHVKGLILVNSTLNLRYSLENQLAYMGSLLDSTFKPVDHSNKSWLAAFMRAKQLLTKKALDYKMLSDNKSRVEQVDKLDRENPSDFDFAGHVFQINDYWKDFTSYTKDIRLPVLVITGAKDHAIGIHHYRSFKFTHQQVVKINGGHLLYYENNPAFIKAVFSFIEH